MARLFMVLSLSLAAISISGCAAKTLYDLSRCGGSGNCG